MIVAIMPIKLNNERLPGKNTMILKNKPLLLYSLESLNESKLIDKIYVCCSDDKICSYLPEYVNFLKRPKELDLPTSNFNQIFDWFCSLIDSDIYVYAHATAPFIKSITITECINKVLSGNYDSAFCAEKIQDFLWKNGVPLNFDSQNLPRSQDLEIIYRETSGIYVYHKEVYKKYRRRIGVHPYIKELSFKESVDINTYNDFLLAEVLVDVNDL